MTFQRADSPIFPNAIAETKVQKSEGLEEWTLLGQDYEFREGKYKYKRTSPHMYAVKGKKKEERKGKKKKNKALKMKVSISPVIWKGYVYI